MNKEKLNKLFNDFLAEVEKLENQKSKYEYWYDDEWKVVFKSALKSEIAEFEYKVSNDIIDELVYGEK